MAANERIITDATAQAIRNAIDQITLTLGGEPEGPLTSYEANVLPVRKKDITDDFFNGDLRSEIAAGNFAHVRPGDYIIGPSSGTTYYVACCDWMYGKGDQTNTAAQAGAYGTHHLGLMVYKHNGSTRMWCGYTNADKTAKVSANDKGACPWNAAADVDPTDTEAAGQNSTNISRTYNGASKSAYLGSFIRERIDAIILEEDFKADFGSANVLKFRNWLSRSINTSAVSGGYTGWTGAASGCDWVDRYIDLPSEVEVYGARIVSSAHYDVGVQCEQLPLFRNAGIYDFFPRMSFWLKAVASSTVACYRSYNGAASYNSAGNAVWACPLACVK